MRKKRLFTPGPTPLLPQAREALARPILHHRTPEFAALLELTRRRLQALLKTSHEVLLLSCSGTGAMEAAVGNLLSPGERALAVVAGKFGERWQEICRRHRIDCPALVMEAGQAATASQICQALAHQGPVAALLIQGCETSTGTSHDLESIAREVRGRFPDTLLVVDAITALLAQPLETESWGLDVVIGGSQKALGVPPGLAFLSLSPRACQRVRAQEERPYYLDLARELEGQPRGKTAFTPAVSLIEALSAAAGAVLEEGVDEVVAATGRMARLTRRGLEALGFRMLSGSPSPALTAAFPPSGISSRDLIRELEARFGLHLAGGQGALQDRIIRVAHLGRFDVLDVFALLGAMELTLSGLALDFPPGVSLQAAMKEALE